MREFTKARDAIFTFNDFMSAQQKQHRDVGSESALIERIERALLLLAYFVELDGDVHLPMYEKFESELQELKKTQNTRARARRLLMEYSAGGMKAVSLPI